MHVVLQPARELLFLMDMILMTSLRHLLSRRTKAVTKEIVSVSCFPSVTGNLQILRVGFGDSFVIRSENNAVTSLRGSIVSGNFQC